MSLEDLPPIHEALLLEKPKLYKIIKEFLPHASYCGSMLLPEKMTDWCSYLQCDGSQCKNEIILQTLGNPVVPVSGPAHCSTNVSRDSILLFNGSCFDNFFCIPEWACKDYHYILGIFGMILAFFSVIFSIVYLIGFCKEFGRKNTRVLLLLSQNLCDIFFILFTMISSLSIYSFHSTLVDQLKLYSSFHVYLVLYLLPFATFFESMSLWILTLLISDRFNYLSHGTHSKNLLTKKICSFILGSIFVALIAFGSLKPLMYQIEKIPENPNHYKLAYSSIGKNDNFQNLLRFWLKMPLESLLPLTTIFIVIAMVIHKMIFAGSVDVKQVSSDINFQELRLTKSILFICCILLLAKVPKMALHILKYEIGIDINKEVQFYLFCEFSDQLYYWIKTTFLYSYMCPRFSIWLQAVICIEHDNPFYGNHKSRSSQLEYDDEDKDYLFEAKCKELLYNASKIDKETIV